MFGVLCCLVSMVFKGSFTVGHSGTVCINTLGSSNIILFRHVKRFRRRCIYKKIHYLTQNVAQYSQHHVPYSAKTFEVVSEYDQEIPQSQTADNPVAP